MSAPHILAELFGQISPGLTVSQVVVCVNDGQLRFKDGLLAQCEPVFTNGQMRCMDNLHGCSRQNFWRKPTVTPVWL